MFLDKFFCTHSYQIKMIFKHQFDPGTTTQGQSGVGTDDNEGVLHTPQN